MDLAARLERGYYIVRQGDVVMKAFIFAGTVMAVALAGDAAAQGYCPKALYAEAEPVSQGIKTWPRLYAFYRAYGACAHDGGDIAEGVSDHVAKLLAYDWTDVVEVSQPLQTDKRFRRFIVDSINTTWDRDDATPARKNAAEHCPDGLGVFCNAVVDEIDRVNAHPAE